MTESEFEIEIVVHLAELDLYPIDHEITAEEVKAKYRNFSKVFHPDGNEHEAFRDGEKQKKINAARDFLLQNLSRVNEFIRRHLRGPREASARAEQEAKARAEREARERAGQEAKARAEREARERAERERRPASSVRGESGASSSGMGGGSAVTASKRRGKIVLALVLLLFIGVPAILVIVSLATDAMSGPTAETVVAVSSAEDLATAGGEQSAGKYYVLGADLDLSEVEWTPVADFRGHLSGNGFVIRGLHIDRFEADGVGLFQSASGAVFEEIALEEVSVASTFTVNGVGALVGSASECTFEACTVSGTVSAPNAKKVGAIVGDGRGVTVRGCSFSGELEGMEDVGGIAGYTAFAMTMSANKVQGTVRGQKRVGGILGQFSNETEVFVDGTENENRADVYAAAEVAGGIVARFYSKAGASDTASFALSGNRNYGDVHSGHCAGGIFGEIRIGYTDRRDSVTDLYNEGTIESTGNYTGGLIGIATWNATLSDSEVKEGTGVTGRLYTGGAVGWFGSQTNDSPQIEGLTLNVHVSGTACSGGIAGCSQNLLNCTFYGLAETSSQLEGYIACGGITGRGEIVRKCTMAGRAVSGAADGSYTGGIVGLLNECGEIANCETTAEAAVYAMGSAVGGILGGNNTGADRTAVMGCTNRAAISVMGTSKYVGGVIGQFNSGSDSKTYEVVGCTNEGAVSAPECSYVGGVIGYSEARSTSWLREPGELNIGNLVCSGDVTGKTYVRGILGYCNNIPDVERLVRRENFTGTLVSSDDRSQASYDPLYFGA